MVFYFKDWYVRLTTVPFKHLINQTDKSVVILFKKLIISKYGDFSRIQLFSGRKSDDIFSIVAQIQ